MTSATQFLVHSLLLFSFSCVAHGLKCTSDQILCPSGTKCISHNYICDGDNDCGDMIDESFCSEWLNRPCSRGEAFCTQNGRGSCVPMVRYCSESSPPCSGSVDPRICQMLLNQKLQRLIDVVLPTQSTAEMTTSTTAAPPPPPPPPDKTNLHLSEIRGQMFIDTLDVTLTHPDCPQLYTRVGNNCLSFFYILKTGWGEAKAFCEIIDGELVSFPDNSKDFTLLMKHLREFGLTSDFWIGGRHANDTQGWSWEKGGDMELGSLFWAVRYSNECLEREEETGDLATAYWSNKTACYHYQQAPRPNTTDLCAAVTFKHYYYITDEDCLAQKSPLCLYAKNTSSSSVTPLTQ